MTSWLMLADRDCSVRLLMLLSVGMSKKSPVTLTGAYISFGGKGVTQDHCITWHQKQMGGGRMQDRKYIYFICHFKPHTSLTRTSPCWPVK